MLRVRGPERLRTIGAVKLIRLMAAAVFTLGAAGCSGPNVRTLGNGDGAPAFELRGDSLAQIEAEAGRLCSRGYVLVRSAQSYAPTQPDDNAATQWFQQAGFWLSGMAGNQAQATILCRA